MGDLIPILGILFPVFIIFIVFYFVFTTDYRKEKLKREERLKAIEAGVEIPPEPVRPPATPLDYLRRGLIWLGTGVGLVIGGSIFAYFQKDPGVLIFAVVGIVTAFIGAALVIFYKIQSKSEK